MILLKAPSSAARALDVSNRMGIFVHPVFLELSCKIRMLRSLKQRGIILCVHPSWLEIGR
jgi:hypothetical protein